MRRDFPFLASICTYRESFKEVLTTTNMQLVRSLMYMFEMLLNEKQLSRKVLLDHVTNNQLLMAENHEYKILNIIKKCHFRVLRGLMSNLTQRMFIQN